MPVLLSGTLVLSLCNLQNMAARNISINPRVIGILQAFADFIAGQSDNKQLVLIRIDTEQIIVDKPSGIDILIEGQWCCERNLSRLRRKAQCMDEIHIRTHAGIRIAGSKVNVKVAHFPECKPLDSLVI